LGAFAEEGCVATVKIIFNGGDVPVLMGNRPSGDTVPIENPIPAGGTTNAPFMALAGVHFYALDTRVPHRPLWLRGRAIDGVPLELTFTKIENLLEMG
jgi:hypothetical protein